LQKPQVAFPPQAEGMNILSLDKILSRVSSPFTGMTLSLLIVMVFSLLPPKAIVAKINKTVISNNNHIMMIGI